MFPFITLLEEFRLAKAEMDKAKAREVVLGHPLPARLEVGAMLETPSIAFAPDEFFDEVDFVSIGGNDLKQFFFAADRENERVRKRYDTLSTSFLAFLEMVIARCAKSGTPLAFCGEDAGRPVEAPVICRAGQTPAAAGRSDRAQDGDRRGKGTGRPIGARRGHAVAGDAGLT